MNLKDLPISGGKLKLLNKKCEELWKGYLQDIPEGYMCVKVEALQAEIESWNREILVIVLAVE